MSAAENGSPLVNRSYKADFLRIGDGRSRAARAQNASLTPFDSAPLIPAAFTQGTLQMPPEASLDAPRVPEPAASQALTRFYNVLAEMQAGRRSEPVTILHIGDGLMASDRFGAEMRNRFQSRFGSAGRGLMMPAVSQAQGIKIDRSGPWTLESSAAGSPGVYGLTGVRMSAATDQAWMRVSTSQTPFDWVEVTFATGPAQGMASVIVDGEIKSVPTASSSLEQTSVRIEARSKEVLIKPRGDGIITVLSIATGTNTSGIRYVSLGLPGASSATPGKWNASFVASDITKLDPALIVLGYGAEDGNQDVLDTLEYEVRLTLLVDQLRELAPAASLLVLGPPDAARIPPSATGAAYQVCRGLSAQEAVNYNRLLQAGDERILRWHTPPKLDAVRSALRRAAAKAGAYYWDWARLMGGPCSIHAWSSARPALASADHVNFTQLGLDRSAQALFADVLGGYEAYQRKAQERVAAIVPAAPPSADKQKPAKPTRKRK